MKEQVYQSETHGKTTESNDNNQQIQTQAIELLSLKDGLQPTRQLYGITAHAGVLFCRP